MISWEVVDEPADGIMCYMDRTMSRVRIEPGVYIKHIKFIV